MQRIYGRTPNYGTYSEIYFFNDISVLLENVPKMVI